MNISQFVMALQRDECVYPPISKDRNNQFWLEVAQMAALIIGYSGVCTFGFATDKPMFSLVK